MIVDKHKQNKATDADEESVDVSVSDDLEVTEYDAIAGNALEDLFFAVSDIIKDIRVDPDDPNSERLFKTVKWNTGQLNRVRHTTKNTEYALAFPACFIHYINVYWNLGYARVGQAYADMRICYVLNRLNNTDEDTQTEGLRVFKQIIEALDNNSVAKISPLTTRFQLSYWDQVESFEKGVQQFWITYEVRCNDYSTYRYKNYKPAYLVAPPFTNFSDMDADKNVDNLENVQRDIEEAASFDSEVTTS